MTEFQFWQYLERYAELRNGWWYRIAVLPVMVIAVCTYLLMIFALRRERKIPVVFFWLLLTSIPVLLIFPSFYVNLDLRRALAQINVQIPASEQQIVRATALGVAQALDYLATLGIFGAALTVVTMIAVVLIGGYAPKQITSVLSNAVSTISQGFTKLMTAVQGGTNSEGEGSRPLNAKYGILTVERSRQPGFRRAVHSDMMIGRVGADLTLIDEIVSRNHAKVIVRGDQVYIKDWSSTNGTFVERGGQTYDLRRESDPFELHDGDRIYLGRPDDPQSVMLSYKR
ncbi:FHA domain-containing protein [Chloroflexus sp.]|uniref:FHA domain-containing protein n=1 Tax=Chloroflexus sp. TaxID=1904827 RepID=UPI00404A581D